MKFGGEFEIDLGEEKTRILLNMTALGEIEEETNLPLQGILDAITSQPLSMMSRVLWHGHRVACWAEDLEPEFSEKKFKALLGSQDWSSIMPKIVQTLSTGEEH